MEIYRGDQANEFNAFLLADAPKSGKRRGILSSPPLYTMEQETLTAFLDARQVAKGLREDILRHAAAQRQRVETILETEQVEDEVSSLSQAEFDKHPPALDVSGAFCESDLCYTYPEYVTHLQETARFAAAHPNYTLKRTAAQAFRNLQIFLREGQWAMVSKGKAPAIHFVIRHPQASRSHGAVHPTGGGVRALCCRHKNAFFLVAFAEPAPALLCFSAGWV